MFAIFRKVIKGRQIDRYFKYWDNAREAMEKDIEQMSKMGLAQVNKRINKMNEDKGFYEYDAEGITATGNKITWCIIELCFEDKPNC